MKTFILQKEHDYTIILQLQSIPWSETTPLNTSTQDTIISLLAVHTERIYLSKQWLVDVLQFLH